MRQQLLKNLLIIAVSSDRKSVWLNKQSHRKNTKLQALQSKLKQGFTKLQNVQFWPNAFSHTQKKVYADADTKTDTSFRCGWLTEKHEPLTHTLQVMCSLRGKGQCKSIPSCSEWSPFSCDDTFLSSWVWKWFIFTVKPNSTPVA